MEKEEKPTKKIEEGEEESKFLGFLNDQVKNHPVVKNHHGKWKELIEWCDNGKQYSEWSADKRKVLDVTSQMKLRRIFLVINLMKPLTEVLDSKLNMNHQIVGYPNSSEISDVAGAKVATKLLAHNSYINEEEALWEDFKYDSTRTGGAWFKWVWDKDHPAHLKSKDGSAKLVDGAGEVIGSVPSVFNMRWDPTAKDIEHARWVLEIDEVTEEELLDTFPKLKQEDLDKSGSSGPEGDKYAGMNEKAEDKDADEKTHIVRYYWERKSKKRPNGRYVMAIPGKILWQGDNPALGELPYWHCYFKRNGNSFIGTGPLHHVQILQRWFNRTASMILEHIEAWKAKMIVPQGSIIKDGAFTNDYAELLEVDTSRGNLTPLQTPPLDSNVGAFRDWLAGMFNMVSNVHEVSYSQLPQYSSRAPASLFSMMLEQENIKIDPLIKRLNKMIVSMAKFRLRLMDKYYKQERLVKVIGKGQESSISYFSGSDLQSNFDVKLAIGVSLYQGKAMQQKLLLELKQNNVLTDNNKILKLLNLGDIETELRGDVADEDRAIRENQQFTNDTWQKPRDKGGVFVYAHDNHEVHLDFHTNLSKTEEAQTWDEAKWQGLQAHIQEHYNFMVPIQQAQAATSAGAPSAGAPAPLGEQPGVIPPAAETMAEGAQAEPEVAQEREMNMVT
jgi:hypothetical protein